MKRVSEGFPEGKPFCCPEVVTNSLEKVIISYLARATSKQTGADIIVKNNTETDEKRNALKKKLPRHSLPGISGLQNLMSAMSLKSGKVWPAKSLCR